MTITIESWMIPAGITVIIWSVFSRAERSGRPPYYFDWSASFLEFVASIILTILTWLIFLAVMLFMRGPQI